MSRKPGTRLTRYLWSIVNRRVIDWQRRGDRERLSVAKWKLVREEFAREQKPWLTMEFQRCAIPGEAAARMAETVCARLVETTPIELLRRYAVHLAAKEPRPPRKRLYLRDFWPEAQKEHVACIEAVIKALRRKVRGAAWQPPPMRLGYDPADSDAPDLRWAAGEED